MSTKNKIDKLVMMANQIADFFGPYPETEATKGIHEHLKAFWTPSMRMELLAYAEAGGAGLRPRVLPALERFRTQPSVIHKAVAGPEELGQAVSDAG
jgi:formate dehydrogenase subunit delta